MDEIKIDKVIISMKSKTKSSKKSNFSIAWSYIKGYRKNTILCVLGIAFSVMLMFSVIQMGDRLLYQYQTMLVSTSPYDFYVRNYDLEKTDEIYSYLLDEEPEFTVSKKCSYGTSALGDSLELIMINGVEGEWETLNCTEVLLGSPPSRAHEICVEEQYCDYLGIKPEELLGDRITLMVWDDNGNEFDITYTVCGIIANAPVNDLYYRMYTTWETAVDDIHTYHFSHSNEYNSVDVVKELYSMDSDVLAALQMKLWEQVVQNDDTYWIDHIHDNETKSEIMQEKEFSNGMVGAFYGMAVLFAVCLVIFVYNTISISMTEKIRQYGTMRCLGLERGGMLRIMGMEVLFYVLLGLVLGILAGTLINYLVADKVIYYLMNMELGAYHNRPSVYAVTILLTLMSVVLALFSIFMKIRKQKPVEMVHATGAVHGKLKVKRRIGERNFLQAMAARNLQRNKSRSRVLYITLTISGMLLMVLINVFGMIDFDRIAGKSRFADYEVYSNVIEEQFIPISQIEDLKQQEGIAEVYYLKIDNEILCTPDQSNTYDTSLVVFSDSLYEKFVELNHIRGVDISNEDVAIVVSYDDDKYQCGSMTLTCTDWLMEQKPRMQKENVVQVDQVLYEADSLLGGVAASETERAYLIINERLAGKIYGAVDTYTDILIDFDSDMALTEIRSMLGVEEYTYIDLKGSLETTQSQLIGMGYLCIYIFLSVTILSVLIINNIIRSNIVNRIREIGMLRSIGAEEMMVRRLLEREIMVLAGRAVLTACVIALPICLWVGFVMNDSYQLTVVGYLLGGVLVLCGSGFFTSVAVRKYLSTQISEMLRNE